MAKRSFNIGKLMKAAHSEFFYEQDGDTVYLADKRGRVAIQTDYLILMELEKRGAKLDNQNKSLKQICKSLLDKKGIFVYKNTGIQLPYWDSLDGKKNLVMFRDYDEVYSVKMADVQYVDIFDPEVITGGKSSYDPILMICKDCYGFIFPVKMKWKNLGSLVDNIHELDKYFETIY